MKRVFSLRALAVLLCALMLCGGLAGCHGAEERLAFEVPENFDTSKNYEITFWAKNDTNITQVNIYKGAIEAFEKLYPNIRVNLRLYTDYAKIYQDVITNISTNTTPNVCISYPDHIATYLTGEGIMVAMDELFTDPKYGAGGSEVKFDAPKIDEIVPKFLSECKVNGYYYAVPFMRSTEALYINKDLVEKLGYTIPDVVTWDFVFEVSEAAVATKGENGVYGINGQTTMIPFIYKSTDNMMIQMLRQKGAGYATEGAVIEIFNDTTKELLYMVGEHAATRAFSTFKRESYPGNFLNAGQCIFAVDSTAGATWMGSDAPLMDIPESQVVKFETVVRPVPQFDVGDPKMISQGPSICLFNKEDPQEVLASWLFVQYLLSNDVQIAYSQTEGYVPVTLKAQQSAEYQDYLSRRGEDNSLYYSVKIDAARLLLAHTEHSFTTPVFNGSASLREAAGELIEDTVLYVRRKKLQPTDEVLEGFFDDVQSLYRLDQISGSGKQELGELPNTSRALLITLGAAWGLILVYVGADFVRKKKAQAK